MNIAAKASLIRACIILFLTLVVYIPAMQAGFIWDDDLFLTKNPLIKASDGLYRFWFTTEPLDYFPLVSTSLWLEWRLWGIHATGYHVVNIVLHAISSVLIWLVLRRLKIPGAWLAALIFAVHPVNVESVAWITERKNTQPMVFYLLTILAYLRFEEDAKRRWYLLALFLHFLALLGKPSIVMLPFVLLGCVWWQRGSITRTDLARSVPFFMLSAFFGLLTVWFQYNVAIGDDIVRTDNFLGRLAGAGCAVWFYLYKALIPYNLSFMYPRWEINSASVISYVPVILLSGFFALFWRYQKGWGKAFMFGLGYFVVTLFPVLGFFDINFMRFSLVTDHWQYTSIIGVIALAVGLGAWTSRDWRGPRRQLARVAALAVVCMFSLLTWVQCHVYKDLESLWRDTIAKNPKAWMAHSNLGTLLASQGKFDEAIEHCSEALRINPTHAWIQGALANALAAQGRLDEAISHFSEAVTFKPDFAEAHNDLGLALKKQGRVEEAISHFLEAVKIKPDFAEAQLNLGLALAEQGRVGDAVEHFYEAVRADPELGDAHYNLGLALAFQGRRDEAISYLSQAVKIKPTFAEAHLNLGALLASQGRLEEAIGHFQEALRIKPDFVQAKQYLTLALRDSQRQGDVSSAPAGR